MATKASEISELIKQQIKNFEHEAKSSDVGTVVSVTDGITRIHGLNDVQYGEMIEFPGEHLAWPLTWNKTQSEQWY